MGMNVQDIFAQDPELLQRRLAMQEMQQLNPSGSAAGAIGAVLGRGLGNVQQGRSFFEVADPALRAVSDMRKIYGDVMQNVDYSNPEDVASKLSFLSQKLQEAGYTQQAMMAAQEAGKYSAQQRAADVQKQQLDISRERLDLERERGERVKLSPITAFTAEDGGMLFYDEKGQLYKDGKPYSGKQIRVQPTSTNPFGQIIAGAAGGQGQQGQPRAGQPQQGQPSVQDQARKAYEDRVKKERADSQRSAGQAVPEIDPMTGDTVYREVQAAPATREQIDKMDRAELQEYYRSGKIPQRLIGM